MDQFPWNTLAAICTSSFSNQDDEYGIYVIDVLIWNLSSSVNALLIGDDIQ